MHSFIPYIIPEGDQDIQIPEEIEVASILLIAISRQGYENPDAIVKVNYPFRIYESEEGKMVFDLLGLSKTEKKWLLPNDISSILTELEDSKKSEDILGMLKRGKEILDQEPEYGSTWIKGMVEQEDVKAYLLESLEANDSEEGIKLELFQPILTKGKFSSMRKKVKSVQKEIENHILSTDQAKEKIVALYEVIKINQEKKLSEFRKESEKRLDSLNKEKEKALKEIERFLKKETKVINDEYKECLLQKTNEINTVNEEIIDLKKKLENGTETGVKRELVNLKKMLRNNNKDIQALEHERERRLSITENKIKSEKNQWEEKFQNKMNEESMLLGNLVETHKMTLRDCQEIENRINTNKATLMKNAESLSKILDIKYTKGKDHYIPFYILKYGEDNYGFYPPTKISQGKSMRKMLKLFIASNLGNKIGQFILPQTDILDGLFEMVITSIKDETELYDQYMKILPKSNILESREALDKMIVGLYQIMEWTWINESDYIKVLRFLVEKLDYLNGGYVFQIKEQEIDKLIETSEPTEITISK